MPAKAARSVRRCARPDRPGLCLALGLAGGILGGAAFSRLFVTRREPRCFIALRRELARAHGEVEAGFISGRVQRRYAELCATRPHERVRKPV